MGARGSPCVPSTNRGADVSARRGGRLWRSEWSGGGTGGGGFAEYLAEGRLNRIWGEFLCVCVGGGGFSRGGRGEFGAWSGSPSAVPRVSEEASRSAFRLCEPCAGPNVCGVQCDRDRGAMSVPPFPFKLGASPPQKKFVASRDPSILLLVIW